MDHVIKSASSGKESFEASLKHAYFRSLENDIVKVENKLIFNSNFFFNNKLVKRLGEICEMTEEVIDFNQDNATTNNDEPDFDQVPVTEEAEPDLCWTNTTTPFFVTCHYHLSVILHYLLLYSCITTTSSKTKINISSTVLR